MDRHAVDGRRFWYEQSRDRQGRYLLICDLQIPFNSFELASIDDAPSRQHMSRHKIRSIGISVLGGRAKISGDYELGIDYVAAIKEASYLTFAWW